MMKIMMMLSIIKKMVVREVNMIKIMKMLSVIIVVPIIVILTVMHINSAHATLNRDDGSLLHLVRKKAAN